MPYYMIVFLLKVPQWPPCLLLTVQTSEHGTFKSVPAMPISTVSFYALLFMRCHILIPASSAAPCYALNLEMPTTDCFENLALSL